jgi:hypothetical protein
MIIHINELITAISLLVVFSTLMFNYFVISADNFINFDYTNITTNEYKLHEHKKKLRSFTLYKWLFPVVILNVIVCWVIMPDAIRITISMTFNLVNFEAIPTVYVLITLYLIIYTGMSIIKFIVTIYPLFLKSRGY